MQTIHDVSKELEENIEKLKKQLDEAKAAAAATAASSAVAAVSPAFSADKEAQMKKRLKELATENVDIFIIIYYLSFLIFDGCVHLEEQITSLKKELEEAKNQSSKRGEKDDKQIQVFFRISFLRNRLLWPTLISSVAPILFACCFFNTSKALSLGKIVDNSLI